MTFSFRLSGGCFVGSVRCVFVTLVRLSNIDIRILLFRLFLLFSGISSTIYSMSTFFVGERYFCHVQTYRFGFSHRTHTHKLHRNERRSQKRCDFCCNIFNQLWNESLQRRMRKKYITNNAERIRGEIVYKHLDYDRLAIRRLGVLPSRISRDRESEI